MAIFKSNQFFYGLSIPEPESIEPIEQKLPSADPVIIDFLHVRTRPISAHPMCIEMSRHESRTAMVGRGTVEARLL
jgi:hypothetical protein